MSTQTTVRPPAPPRPPTMAEIQSMMPGLRIYNPSDEWIQLRVHGRADLWIAPDLNGEIEPHPATGAAIKCDGMLEVKSRFLTQRDSSGKTIEGQDAFAIVSYLIHRDRYGEMGLVYLPGRDATEDEGFKAHGRELYLKYREGVDDKVIQRRHEYVANWRRNPAKQGTPVPAPTDREQDAIDRASEREHRKTYEFECHVEDCAVGYASNDFTKYARHMASAHKVQVSRDRRGTVTMRNAAGDVQVISEAKGTGGNARELTQEEVEAEQPEPGEPHPGIAQAAAALAVAKTESGKARGAPRRKART